MAGSVKGRIAIGGRAKRSFELCMYVHNAIGHVCVTGVRSYRCGNYVSRNDGDNDGDNDDDDDDDKDYSVNM